MSKEPNILEPTNRNDFIDYMRGILIVLVIEGHIIQNVVYKGNNFFFDDPIFKAIYTFHMPCFILISGFFTYQSLQRRSILNFSLTRFFQLLVPILFWTLPLMILSIWDEFSIYFKAKVSLHFIFTHFITYPYVMNVLWHSLWDLWFLWTLIACSLLLALLRFFKKDNGWCLLGACVVLLFCQAPLPGILLDYIKNLFPFFCLGYFWAAHFKKIPKVSLWHVLLLVGLSVLCYLQWDQKTYIYLSGMGLTADNVPRIVLRYASGCVMSLLFVLICRQIYQLKSMALLSRFGYYSLQIYVLQRFFLERLILGRIDIAFIQNHPLFSSFILAPIMAFLFCVVLTAATEFINKNIFFRAVAFGKFS